MKIKLSPLLLFGLLSFASSAQTTNYQVYSVFVVNIARYSSWPEVNGDFKIAVLGKSKIVEELVKNTASKNINGAKITVEQMDNVEEAIKANIIYVPDGKSSQLSELLKITEGKPVMIITEREGLFKKGAGFSFVVMDNGSLRVDINNSELEKRRIKVSKNLSSLANTTI
jgi:hypothetical protein